MSETSTLPSSPSPKRQKLGGYDFYRSIGSPKWIVAPMVDQSELAWRMLSRSPLPENLAGPSTSVQVGDQTFIRHTGGAHLCYTPMIHAKIFAQSGGLGRGGEGQFNLADEEEGSVETIAGIQGGDRPLFVQFCANDPEYLLAAAKKVEHRCDAVDINFGCPQGIAKRGHYGAFLQDDWDLIKRLIGTLHENLSIPVTAKFRIFPDLARTIAYAKMLEAAGAQIITCHGRTREMKGQFTGLADWEVIREVKKAVKIPVFANGNILYREDVDKCLEITGCDGVMTAEGNLSNPALFVPPDHAGSHPPIVALANRYLDIVDALETPTSPSAIKAHLYRMLKKVLDADEKEELRIMIARANSGHTRGSRMIEFRKVIKEIERRLQSEFDPKWRPSPLDPETGYRTVPDFAAQPYIRPTAKTEVNPDDDNENTNVVSRCAGENCSAMSAMRCPSGACLIHCRQIRAIAQGMDPIQAGKEAAGGGLVGNGCEAHEQKVAARQERLEAKRKNRQESRQANKIRKVEQKAKLLAKNNQHQTAIAN
ncbi:hypothetical protein BCR39DRAFT_549079 [Naematelia encephala]|uniref:tRNA-dihydrouridine(16/17) synthase [NAD(P)(+)] n=1 Tax=Naematelia encephala TaxID=71784 RepID=A0A1Y2AM11_9TREE|nr:hypothetical protein BCR39DRAFT_549079 [Naematelia encephala]